MKKMALIGVMVMVLAGCLDSSDSLNLRTEIVFSKANGEVTQEFQAGETIYFEVYITNADRSDTAVMKYSDCEGFDMAIKDSNEEILWTEDDRGIACTTDIKELIIYPQERLKVYDGKLDYLDEDEVIRDLQLAPGTYHADLELVEGYGGFSSKQITVTE